MKPLIRITVSLSHQCYDLVLSIPYGACTYHALATAHLIAAAWVEVAHDAFQDAARGPRSALIPRVIAGDFAASIEIPIHLGRYDTQVGLRLLIACAAGVVGDDYRIEA